MRKLKFIQVCPDDDYFIWQVHIWLESLRAIDQSKNACSLITTPMGRAKNKKWKMLVDIYTEAEFHFYEGDSMLNSLIPSYIPIIRPYTLWRHFSEFPDLVNYAIFYCDADTLFTSNFNVDHLIEDNINYLSDTKSYISAAYFDSKSHDVLPEKKENYAKRDILEEVSGLIGIDRNICVTNNENSGGAQYLLKNLTASFWRKVMIDCISIKKYLERVNQEFFENESRGYQSWCADMWAILWNLWFRENETRVVKEMDFAWATDPITRLEKTPILHNAGITGPIMDGLPVFYKGKYHRGGDPTKDKHFWDVLDNPETAKKCTWYYAKQLAQIKEKYKLNY